jgi:hypothetical protein
MRRCSRVIACAALLALAGCEAMTSPPAPSRGSVPAAMSDALGRAMVRTELVFGLTRDDGSAIDELDWQHFVDSAVTAWFPNGFTIIDASGRWRGMEGSVASKRSKLLILIHDGSEANLRKIDELRRIYTQRFGQQSVLRSSSHVRVAF